MTEPQKKPGFSFGMGKKENKKQACTRGNIHCEVAGEKENHFHCSFCYHSNHIFTTEEELKKHQMLHYF